MTDTEILDWLESHEIEINGYLGSQDNQLVLTWCDHGRMRYFEELWLSKNAIRKVVERAATLEKNLNLAALSG